MQLIPVASDAFDGIGFLLEDKANQRGSLVVRFNSGDIWRYFNVPVFLWTSFYSAPSRGNFYQSRIKGAYTGTKMTESELSALTVQKVAPQAFVPPMVEAPPTIQVVKTEPTALVVKKLRKIQRELRKGLNEVNELLSLFGEDNDEDDED